MSPRIIVHIGQQKTGSTSVQSALVDDRRRLARAGVLYPDAGHARGLAGELRPSHNAIFFLLQGNQGPRLWQSLDDIGRAIDDQIRDESPDVVLISAEHAFMAADQSVDVLDGLDRLVPGPKEIVVYLRRPDRYLMSFHKQLVQLGVRSLTPLHRPERLDHLERTCQLDHRRALGRYIDRYESFQVFDYDQAGDAVTHFYRHVLNLDPPAFTPRVNPSIPSVLTNLALQRVVENGRMAQHDIRALLQFGEREAVDLLGPENRDRLPRIYEPHNAFVGRLVGRDRFFDDLDAMREAPPGAVSVDAADQKYDEMFRALMSRPTIHELRSLCLALEGAGKRRAASELFELHRPRYSGEELAWFRSDVEARSGPAPTGPKGTISTAASALNATGTRAIREARRLISKRPGRR